MAKATITTDKVRYTVTEGTTAESVFNFSQALDNDAKVVVRLQGIGATKNKDFEDLYYSTSSDGPNNTVVWSTPVKVDNFLGTILLPEGSTGLKLSSNIKTDTLAGEQNESLLFSVAQTNLGSTSKVLENSYYVTSTVNIKEPTNSYFSKITVDTSVPASVTEGNDAVGAFKLSKPLSGKAVITAQVEGHGATLGQDTAAAKTLKFEAFNDSGVSMGAASLVSNGRVTLEAGTKSFKLWIATEKDNITESPEQVNFKVGQVSGNLKDSYYVNSVVELNDPRASNVVNPNTADESTGTSGQDIFDMTNANSAPFVDWQGNAAGFTGTNGADLITGFGTGDVIKLQESVQRYSIGTVSFEDFTEVAVTNNETTNGLALVKALNEDRYGENFRNGTGSILKIVESDEIVWLLIDTNANGIIDTRYRPGKGDGLAGGLDNQYDTLIKVVGSVNDFGETLAEQITGDSFLTE